MYVLVLSHSVMSNSLQLHGPYPARLLWSTGILQARILERVVMPSSWGSSQLRDGTQVSCIGRQVLYHRATRKDLLGGGL